MEDPDRPRPAPAARRRRQRDWRAVLAAVTLLLGAGPPSAAAQNPFAPLPSQPTPTPTVATPTTSAPTVGGGGLSTTEQVVLFAAGLLLIGGIAYLIRRDAHAQAPAGRPGPAGPRGTVRPRAKRVEQSRARAKAARRQRKRGQRRR